MAKEQKNDVFVNTSKKQRAEGVIANPARFPEEGVERKALARCKEGKLEGEELLRCVYSTIGGGFADAPVEQLASGVISEEKIGKEKEELPAPGSTRKRAPAKKA